MCGCDYGNCKGPGTCNCRCHLPAMKECCSQAVEAALDERRKKRNETVYGKGMNAEQAVIGTRVRVLVSFSGVPAGTEGVIDQDYGSGVMVAWDLPDRPLPKNYSRPFEPLPEYRGMLRDGFNKEKELQFLEVVKNPAMEPGIKIDILVAEKVMDLKVVVDEVASRGYSIGVAGIHGADVPQYSTKIEDAWKVVEKINIVVGKATSTEWSAAIHPACLCGFEVTLSPTAPMAICLAALKEAGVTP